VRPFAHRPDEYRTRRIGFIVAAFLGRNGVVLHRECQVWTPDRPAFLFEMGEGVMGV
jgi:hypothetical protein